MQLSVLYLISPTEEADLIEAMSEQPRSIRALFLDAERTRQNLANSYDTNSASYQERLQSAIATYEECLQLSEQVSLFSPNETLEDVSSTDLQYVAPPHLHPNSCPSQVPLLHVSY